MFIRLSFVTLVFAMVALGTPVKRNTEKVLMDISDLRDKSQALDDSVRAYPMSGGTPQQLADILEASQELKETIGGATDDVKANGGLTDADASTVIERLQNDVAPIVKQGLSDFIDKKEAFAPGLVYIARMNLMNLKDDTDTFVKAIDQRVPTDKQSEVQELKTQIDGEFDKTIEAYSS